ncbi:MAG: ribosome small subunit-dependent GTPase A, partial [Gammaproteobacteria bacterium]
GDKHNPHALQGLVISRAGKAFIVEASSGPTRGQRYCCHARQHLELVVGDRVLWEAKQHMKGWITSCEPRDTLIERFSHGRSTKLMAANVTALVIVVAPKPAPSRHLINQYLIAATIFGCTPIITLNKFDLMTAGDTSDCIINQYETLGFTCLRISTKDQYGLDALAQLLTHHTAILLGQSGVGKSSLVKAWLPDESIVVGGLSNSNDLGRHTTSNSTLYHLPSGGHLIDAPGIREFKLSGRHPIETLSRAFPDIQPKLHTCHFRDCSHQHEPDCGLKAAVQAGELDAQRLSDYLAIISQFGAR